MKEYIPLLHPNSNQEFTDLWVKICLDGQREHDEWVARLRAVNVKAAHPNDGWVNREECYVDFCYPQFNDNPQVGDVIVLGWPGKDEKKNVYARVTKIDNMFGGKRYYYQAIKK